MKGLSGIWLLVVSLCSVVSCSALQTLENKLTPPYHIPTKDDLVRIVYIDKSFGNWEDAIIAGLRAWECKTDGMVKFTIVRDVDLEQPNMVINPMTSIIIKRVLSTDDIIVEEDKKFFTRGAITLGIYTSDDAHNAVPIIVLCGDRLWGDISYRAITEHEAGHALNLSHSESHDSIMYWTLGGGAGRITDNDLQTFCSIYDCDWKAFKNKCE